MPNAFPLDLTNYKNRIGDRVPEGTYPVVVEDVEAGKSSAGNAMLTVWFRVLGGQYDGASIIDRLTQTEAALFRTVSFLSAIGIKTPRKRFQIDLDRVIGRKLSIRVEDGEPYRGTVKSEVREHLKLDQPESSEAADLDDLTPAPPEEALPTGQEPPEAGEEDLDLDTLDL